jgi:acyl carrier protein
MVRAQSRNLTRSEKRHRYHADLECCSLARIVSPGGLCIGLVFEPQLRSNLVSSVCGNGVEPVQVVECGSTEREPWATAAAFSPEEWRENMSYVIEQAVLEAIGAASTASPAPIDGATQILDVLDSLGLVITMAKVQSTLQLTLDPEHMVEIFSCRSVAELVGVIERVAAERVPG